MATPSDIALSAATMRPCSPRSSRRMRYEPSIASVKLGGFKTEAPESLCMALMPTAEVLLPHPSRT